MTKGDDEGGAPAASASNAAATGAGGGAAKPAAGEENLLSVASGAIVVDQNPPDESSYDFDAHQLLDDDVESFFGPEKTGAHTIVISVPQKTTFKRFTWKGDSSKVSFEASDDPMGKKGFQKIGEAKLAAKAAPQTIAVTKEVLARTIKVTFENPEEQTRNYDLRGFGTKVDDPGWAARNITGHFRLVNGNELYLRQTGTLVRGCWASDEITGTIEGSVVKARLRHGDGDDGGPAILNLAPDNSRAYLFRWRSETAISFFSGARAAAIPPAGECALTDEKKAAAAPDPIAAELDKLGRARIYGIRFDTDSDVIKPESKPVLDRVVAVLKAKPALALTVEGHTDDTATPQYNQGLSERRANAVKKWLETNGIAAGRLKATGLGQTKPVASNKSALGRAENRRVELAKQ